MARGSAAAGMATLCVRADHPQHLCSLPGPWCEDVISAGAALGQYLVFLGTRAWHHLRGWKEGVCFVHPWVPPCRLWVWGPPGHHLMGGRRCGEVPGLWLFPSHGCLTWATLPDFRLGKAVSIQQSRKQKHSDGFGSKFRIGVSNFSSKFHIPQEWIHKLISLPSPQKGSPCAQIAISC